jgi:hypothetical protein
MRELYNTLSNKEVLDNKYFIDLCSNGDSPDIILAALLGSFDRSSDTASTVSQLAIDRLLSVVAETASFDTNTIKMMLYRAIVDYAKSYNAEIYKGFEAENPFGRGPKPKWIWPEIEVGGKGGEIGLDGEWRPFSALKLFGYTVGKTAGWSTKKRRAFLSDFMEMDLPESVERYFDDEYGSPLTTTRLRKVAMVISSNLKNRLRQRNSQQYAETISDWTENLNFLKEKYYEGYGLKFVPWPHPRN